MLWLFMLASHEFINSDKFNEHIRKLKFTFLPLIYEPRRRCADARISRLSCHMMDWYEQQRWFLKKIFLLFSLENVYAAIYCWMTLEVDFEFFFYHFLEFATLRTINFDESKGIRFCTVFWIKQAYLWYCVLRWSSL